jgi:hypothetical protein
VSFQVVPGFGGMPGIDPEPNVFRGTPGGWYRWRRSYRPVIKSALIRIKWIEIGFRSNPIIARRLEVPRSAAIRLPAAAVTMPAASSALRCLLLGATGDLALRGVADDGASVDACRRRGVTGDGA